MSGFLSVRSSRFCGGTNRTLQLPKQTIKPRCGTTLWGTHHFRVVLHVVVWVNEKNVLRLQISVRQLVSMQNWKKKRTRTFKIINRQTTYFAAKKKERYHLLTAHCSDNLVCHVPDVFHRKRLEIVFLEEIVGAEAKKLKGNTNMAAKVKPVQHMHTRAAQKKCNCKYEKLFENKISWWFQGWANSGHFSFTYYLFSVSNDLSLSSTSTSDIAASR